MKPNRRTLVQGAACASLIGGACLALCSLAAQDTREAPAAGNAVQCVETGLRVLCSEQCERREAVWTGQLAPGRRVMLPFFFFKEHDYFVVIALDDIRAAEQALELEMLDLVGIPIACHTGVGEGRIVIAARPAATGTAYLSMKLREQSKPVTVAVGCAYR